MHSEIYTRICGWAAAFAISVAGISTAQADDYYDYYHYYDGGYDADYDDDWFYDYYDYDAGAYDGDYGYYGTYDYDADVFDWEEDGLFE
jgi:hypothetical protein